MLYNNGVHDGLWLTPTGTVVPIGRFLLYFSNNFGISFSKLELIEQLFMISEPQKRYLVSFDVLYHHKLTLKSGNFRPYP